ncbi:cupin domain-containing protein [Thermosynechococcaceae cyanobacterium BACA0444]|uniref:Cupin domain-containing protein n=1 Tax=Pseudocalidococcus azoricus BACA0444 TaxID=2918990 RepID=A0AAE4FTL8_9CYAN|nr:cupin domain-containing protein [Pseudocalidococcus azoricus]MDS3861608.1 cupin domain-containing protein [Pseudocalidococcus azoricus BACA0444]
MNSNKLSYWVRSVPPVPLSHLESSWGIKPLYQDYPGLMGTLSTYYSVLAPGHIPHEIHTHDDEEIIVLLAGELDILAPDHRVPIGPGSFFHHPPHDPHTIEAVGSEVACFLVFKWKSELKPQTSETAEFFLFNAQDLPPWDQQKGFQLQVLCENQPLTNGGTLKVGLIHLAPNQGYPPHSHDHDLMLVLLHGEMKALGHNTNAPAVIYYPARTLHALAPVSPAPITIIEFEFHRGRENSQTTGGF